ncbi:hypothetical protein CIT292_10469 [Citrobacter youngae ATCC 29220]|uniref:Uncharacterized protein n=1 Tax=Citrobacter youngae ATCC 29220 TaxID=500640 RepID=D4BIV2_9ENTR|nr:hypothetical protein CIT292_10469 [Citrobacter youngae ATCC 29220]
MWGNNGGIPEQWGKYAGKSRCPPLFSYLAGKGGGFHPMPRQCWFFCFLSQKMGEPAREKKVGDNLGARGKDSIFPDAVRGR